MSENNSLKNTVIEFHILQSFPVTCLNRDDVGAPKTAIVGGSPRARVSSQCWKRQVRLAMHELGIELGIRTKLISALIKKACLNEGATEEQADRLGARVSAELSDGKNSNEDGESSENEDSSDSESNDKGATLLFLSNSEVSAFAKKMKAFGFSFAELEQKINELEKSVKNLKKDKKTKNDFDSQILKDKETELRNLKSEKDISAIFKKGFSPAVDGLDIALFGRMAAKAASMNVEAAASFAHAISTHKVSNEVEFFTAIDDLSTEQGSAHMGSLEFNSATYYRYVSLDLGQLQQTLHGINLAEAVEGFTKALFTAVPNARQTTQSGASPWEFAKIFVRKGQRLQVPFETAVKAKDGGFLQPSVTLLKEYLAKKEKLAGSLFAKQAEYTFGEDENFSIDNLVVGLKEQISKVGV